MTRNRIIPILICTALFFSSPVRSEEQARGLFVTTSGITPVLSSRKAISRLIDTAKKARVNTLFVQIYRSNEAWFPSNIGGQRMYESALKSVGEDPFALLIKQAHAAGIEVHAWLNLLSLGNNKDARILKKYGPDILTRNLKLKNRLEDYKIDEQYFLEPGDPRVRGELRTMVAELLRAYPGLDGVQFDYIRYPDVHPAYGYTKINMERFKKATGRTEIVEGSAAWNQWKRDQVSGLLKQLVHESRALRPRIQVSTTGCVSYVRAHDEAFQDWPSWLNGRLVDFVTIMDYPEDMPTFAKYIADARKRVADFRKVNVAVGAYKLVKAPEVFGRQWKVCEASGARACVVFHYGSLLECPVLKDHLSKN